MFSEKIDKRINIFEYYINIKKNFFVKDVIYIILK